MKIRTFDPRAALLPLSSLGFVRREALFRCFKRIRTEWSDTLPLEFRTEDLVDIAQSNGWIECRDGLLRVTVGGGREPSL